MTSDEQLLSRFLAGDGKAFEELVTRYEAPIRKLVYGLVRDWGAAEDIAQDAFIRAYRKAGSFRQGSKVKAWLYRIAINRAQDELRRRHRKKEVPLEEHFDAPATPAGHTESLAGAWELERHLAGALSEMRDDYRTPLILREIEGMTYREIAELLGWPLGTVQARIHRARLELRSRLQEFRGKGK